MHTKESSAPTLEHYKDAMLTWMKGIFGQEEKVTSHLVDELGRISKRVTVKVCITGLTKKMQEGCDSVWFLKLALVTS